MGFPAGFPQEDSTAGVDVDLPEGLLADHLVDLIHLSGHTGLLPSWWNGFSDV